MEGVNGKVTGVVGLLRFVGKKILFEVEAERDSVVALGEAVVVAVVERHRRST